MGGHCMACGYTGPASSFRVERAGGGGDWERCPACRSNDVQEVRTMLLSDPAAGMRADLDVATRAWLENGAGLIAECSPSISRDWNKLLSRINVMRERNGLDPLPRPDHWLPESED